MPDVLGGAAIPVRRVTSGPLQGGPVKAVYGYFAAPGDRPAGGGPAMPVRVLTSLEIAAGGYIVEGGAAIPVYDAPAGTPEMGGAALPVYALNGVAAWPFSYLLRDEFTDTLAAGAVNGTPAVPGPGTRTVVDTNGIMSTSGGVLVVNGTPAANNRFHLGSVARVAGRVFKGTFPAMTTAPFAVIEFGWSIDGTTDVNGVPGIDYSSTTVIRPRDGISAKYSFTMGAAPHSVALVLRATGGWSFALVGGKWVMLYIHPTNATATLFPKIMLTGASAVNFTHDSFRVPQSLYIPTPLAYAAFGGANGPLGNTDVLGPDLQLSPVLAWADQVGTWAIATNKATASALAGGLAIATVPTSSPDTHIRIALTRAGGSVGGVARYQDASNYLRFSHDGTNALCEQVVAGVPTTLRTGAAAFVASALIYLRVSGTTGWLFYNNAAVGASFTIPASTQKNHGLYTTNTGNTMDNFEAFPDGTGSEHAFLGLI
jgi:hypothetical protein